MKKWLCATFIFLLIFSFVEELKATTILNISEKDVAKAVEEEFHNQGLEDNVEFEFFGGETSFNIENASKFKLLISTLKIDEMNGRFSCNLEVYADMKLFKKVDLQGKYYFITEVYVPAENIQKGKVITDDMLEVVSIRMVKVKSNFIVEKEKLLDMEAKKFLKKGQLVNFRDIGKINLIKKGKIVNIVYRSSGIQIIAKGEAVTDGAKGENIELINTKSKRKVFGIVVDADNVEIETQ